MHGRGRTVGVVGVLWSLLTGRPDPVVGAAVVHGEVLNSSLERRSPQFSVDQESIPAQVFGLESYADPVAMAPRVDRRSAMQVPAVKRSRDLVAGSIGTLPLTLSAPDRRTTSWSLLEQPEPDRTRSWTLTKLVEDMLFDQVGWWRVLARDWRGYPTSVRRLDPRSVTVRKDARVYVSNGNLHSGMAMEWVADADLIRFDSPNDGILTAGARAIRTSLRIEAAAAKYAEGSPPVDWFESSDGVDPEDPQAFVNAWFAARKLNQTAYVPGGLKYKRDGWTPKELQLVEARQQAVLEIARITGVDPEELGVSTTSRTYANMFERRKAFLDFTLGPFMAAIEQRLSMNDVSPRGYRARFDLDAFLRSDPAGRYEAYAAGLAVGAITKEEIREAEDRPVDALPLDPEHEPATEPEESASA